jgi:hypothetical protein
MLGVIDRFEENFVIVQLYNNNIVNIEKREIPLEAKEGYVLNIGNSITIDYEETKKRKIKIENLTQSLWR